MQEVVSFLHFDKSSDHEPEEEKIHRLKITTYVVIHV